MLTDEKNIFENKVIECKICVFERKIIKQGCQTEFKFERVGVENGV